jgi:hypothetical protein
VRIVEDTPNISVRMNVQRPSASLVTCGKVDGRVSRRPITIAF